MGDAVEEAKRLCKKEKKEFVVLEAVSLVRVKDVPVEVVDIGFNAHKFIDKLVSEEKKEFLKCVTSHGVFTTNPPTYLCQYCKNTWVQGYALPTCKNQERITD